MIFRVCSQYDLLTKITIVTFPSIQGNPKFTEILVTRLAAGSLPEILFQSEVNRFQVSEIPGKGDC